MISDDTGAGKLLGITPLRRTIGRSADELTFEIRLDGYDTMRVPTPATTDRTVNVSLKRSPPARNAAKTAPDAARATVTNTVTKPVTKTAAKRSTKSAAKSAVKAADPRAEGATPARRARAVEVDDSNPYAREKTIDPFR